MKKKVDVITVRVAENLAIARREKSWTQADLAKRLKCSKHAVMTWETCRNEISNETLLRIAEELDKKWLWFYQPQDPPSIFEDAPSAAWQLEAEDRRLEARREVGQALAANAVAHRHSGVQIPAEYQENREELNYLTALKVSGKPMKPEDEARYEELLLKLRYFYFHESPATSAPSVAAPSTPEYNRSPVRRLLGPLLAATGS